MSRSADRNLLFGLLALQNNFIDRDALVDAFHRWTSDRSKPLDLVLLDRGTLTPSRHLLLAGLVEEHIKLHGGDPEKSLAALSSIGSVRKDLSRIADSELQASLAQVSAAPGNVDDPYRTVTQPSLGESTSDGSRFRILRPHAKGGLGQVSIALDQELDRPVALKEIQERHADDRLSRSRFVQEAEITGKLEHPGIIPVYGLGHDAGGRPFYAMRFIEGDSLKEAIAAFHGDEHLKRDPVTRSFRLRELLRRFTDVCNAIAYAHSRGVLHRDLKPGNIMLGPYGETLVVDWGLAKPSDHATSPARTAGPGVTMADGPIRLSALSGSRDETAAGSMIGTPAYASPEQVAGRLDLIGPASDVYGLGATLYSLLTGRAPADSDQLEEIIRRVQRGEIASVRSIDATIPKPLEAICKKAMALKPEARYQSARALASEVTRWLDDQPVAAYRESWPARAGRWMRLHRTLVTSTAAVVVVGLAVLAVFATVLAGKNRELDLKNGALADKNGQLDATNGELAAKNRELDTQRRRAEERETLAIDAVKKFRDAVKDHTELKNRPELASLRKALLKEPMEFFRKLRDQIEADRDTRSESLMKLAGANFDLATTTRQVGSIADAMKSYSEAVVILERLSRDHPTVVDYQRSLATSHHNIGLLLRETGHPTEALESFRQTLEYWGRLARDNPADPEFLSGTGREHLNIGVTLLRTGHPTEALESYRKALEIQERLVRDNPTVDQYQSNLADSHLTMGNLLRASGKPAEAMESYRLALAVRTRLARDNPTVPDYQFQLSRGHFGIAYMLNEIGRPTEALESYRSAAVIAEQIVRDNPSRAEFQSLMAGIHSNIGLLLGSTGHPVEQLDSYERALKIREQLARDNPSYTQYQSDLATSYNNLGALRSDSGHPTEALKFYQRSLEICERLAHDNPSSHEYQSDLGMTLHNMAEIEMGQHQWDSAQRGLQRACECQRKALIVMPKQPVYLQFLRSHLINLAKVRRALGQATEAAKVTRAFVEVASGRRGDLYDAACAFSLTIPLAKAEQKSALAAEAVQTLNQAIAAGWKDAAHTARDPDLIPLRDRADFRRLLAVMFDRGFPADPFSR
jgi:serine/threonine protein kinase